MKTIIFPLVLCFLIDLIVSKRSKNKTNLNKVQGKKNNTHRSFLIRTELNKTELEKLLNNNQTLILNKTIVDEIDDENDTYADEYDIEIEDEIDDNVTMSHSVDFLAEQNKVSEAQSLLVVNDVKYAKKGKIGIILPFINLIFFIFVLINLNKWKNKEKSVRIYKLFDLDSKRENIQCRNVFLVK